MPDAPKPWDIGCSILFDRAVELGLGRKDYYIIKLAE